MRKNTARHWLHAVLDLLPVLLIPVFMIYSHRHEINNGSIQVQEKIAVDFNQLLEPNKNLVIEDTTYQTPSLYNFVMEEGHEYLFKWYQNDTLTSYVRNTPSYYDGLSRRYFSTNSTTTLSQGQYEWLFTALNNYDYADINWWATGVISVSGSYSITDFQLFDLTKMNLTKNEFDIIFTDSYYPYTKSNKMLVNKSSLTTFNDTDIMSQFTYQLYNSVDKYFNMNNVFGMNNVYEWFELNIFGGSAPLYIYIVWQIVLYEFVMDLLFLLYGLFMFFIDMCKRLMEKPLDSIK